MVQILPINFQMTYDFYTTMMMIEDDDLLNSHATTKPNIVSSSSGEIWVYSQHSDYEYVNW